MPSYQPQTTDGLAEWWQNIQVNGSPALTALGFAAAEVTAIMDDAKWAILAYRDLRVLYESYHQSLIAYADAITFGPIDAEIPVAPTPPTFPTLPTAVVLSGVERRRELWVQRAKNSLAYTQSFGETLRVVPPEVPFDPSSYVAKLTGLKSPGPRTVSGKFRKEYGNVDGIILSARKDGTSGWVDLGRFTAIPFSAEVPISGSTPELWEFQARAFKRDVPFGTPSDIQQLTILP